MAPTNVSRPYLRVVAPVFLNLMTSSLCVTIYNTAIYQIQERIICKQHYDDVVDSTTDPRCKGPAVQGDFSLLIGVQNTFELIPTLLSGILYGVVADTYGRKPVFVLCTFGAFLHLAADAVICTCPSLRSCFERAVTVELTSTEHLRSIPRSSSAQASLGICHDNIYWWWCWCLHQH